MLKIENFNNLCTCTLTNTHIPEINFYIATNSQAGIYFEIQKVFCAIV